MGRLRCKRDAFLYLVQLLLLLQYIGDIHAASTDSRVNFPFSP